MLQTDAETDAAAAALAAAAMAAASEDASSTSTAAPAPAGACDPATAVSATEAKQEPACVAAGRLEYVPVHPKQSYSKFSEGILFKGFGLQLTADQQNTANAKMIVEKKI